MIIGANSPIQNDSYTKLLLRMDGADNGTSFVDSSASGHTVTRSGAVTKTGTKKFGTASAYFDGMNDYASVPDSSDFNFGAGKFEISFWINFQTVETEILYKRWDAGNKILQIAYIAGSGIRVSYSVDGATGVEFIRPFSPSASIWYNIALQRDGADMRVFINGAQSGDVYNIGSAAIHSGTVTTYIATNEPSTNFYLHGYIDQLSISKGIARYTRNFQPPNRAH